MIRERAVASWAPAGWLCWALLAVLALSDLVYIGLFARDFPIADEIVLTPMAVGESPISLAALWGWHNEHRIPLPKLLYLMTVAAAGGDVRGAMVANVAVLAACATLFLLLYRRQHGGYDLPALAIPALFLGWGMAENFLNGFQIHFATCCLLVSLLWFVYLGGAMTAPRLLAAAVLTLCLPLCGGPTLAYVPAMLPALLLAAWRLPRRGMGLLITMATAAVMALLACAYFRDFVPTASTPFHATHFLAAIVYFFATAWGAVTDIPALLLGVLSLGIMLVAMIRPPARPFAWFLFMGAGLVAAAIATGRGMIHPETAGTPRYAGLLTPALAGAVVLLAWDRRRWPAVVTAGLAAVMLIPGTNAGAKIGRESRRLSNRLIADVARNIPVPHLAVMYAGAYFNGHISYAREQFTLLQRHGLSPFAGHIPAPPLAKTRLPIECSNTNLLPGEDGWLHSQPNQTNFLEFTLPPAASIYGVHLVWEVRLQDMPPSAFASAWTRWREPYNRLPTAKGGGYWLRLKAGRGNRTFWIYDTARKFRFVPHIGPFSVRLISASAVLPAADMIWPATDATDE